MRRRHVCECSFCLHPHRKPFKCGFLRKLPTRRCEISMRVTETERERDGEIARQQREGDKCEEQREMHIQSKRQRHEAALA